MGLENNQQQQNQQPQQQQAAQGLAQIAQNLTASDVASVSSAGVSITLRSEKEKGEGLAVTRSLCYNPLKYWNAADRNARQ